MKGIFWFQVVIIILLGTLGSVLFKMGVNNLKYELNNLVAWLKFIFTPTVFLGLAFLFFSRILWSIPLSDMHIGRFTMIIMPLSLISISIASHFLFKETLTFKQGVGVGLTLIGIYLLASG